jgi:ligand-binding sensor domain-containing protein/signal transduction histidine kinase
MLFHVKLQQVVLLIVGILSLFHEPRSAFSQVFPFKQYNMNDGLISNGVKTLLQDRKGFLWIGTADGVSVYNGYEFRNYGEAGGHSLGLVTALAESKISPGTVWIGSFGTGLNRFSNGDITIHQDSLLFGKQFLAMFEDATGSLWCGTQDGLYVIDGTLRSPSTKILDGYIHDVVESRDGHMWVATENEVNVFSQKKEKLTRLEMKRYRAEQADHMLASVDGSVWIATDSGTVLQFRDTLLVAVRAYHGDHTIAMSEDSYGYLWLSTENGQVIKLSKTKSDERPELLTTKNGLAGEVLTVLIDREDNLWLGLLGYGLQKLTYRNVSIFPIETLPLGPFYQTPISSDSAGRFWAIALDGLMELASNETGTWSVFKHTLKELGLKSRLTCVQFGPKGTMWVGTVNGTIHELDVKRSEFRPSRVQGLREFKPVSNLGKGNLTMFVVDRYGNLWCNLQDIAVLVFDSTFTLRRTLTEFDGLPSTTIKAMFLDRDNVMWFGGIGKGIGSIPLNEIQSGRLKPLKSSDGLPDEAIRAIFQDSQGRMIFGTRFNGLAIYDNGVFSTLRTSDGLWNNCIWSISPDGDDHVWICTLDGLQRVNLKTLRPENFLNALGSDRTISCSVSHGTVVGWRYGSILIYEHKPPAGANPAPIYITALEINARPVALSDSLTFSHDLNTCTIEFVGISFREDNGLRYRYRLLGLDPEWSLPSAERAVTFAQLPPDTYRFEVRAIDKEGVQSLQPAFLVFTIRPPFWRTWWTYSVYVLTLVAAGIGWRRYEINNIRRKEREEAAIREAGLRTEIEKQKTRMQIARDLHDEVGSTLSSITFFAQAMSESQHSETNSGNKFLSLITESSSHAKEAMSDIIWSINPTNDSWENIASKLRRYASDLFESKGIAHSIEMPPTDLSVNIDPERRRHFWLLFKEIVTNAAKHSHCTEVHIRLRVHQAHVSLTVLDNGAGFDSRNPPAGHGLNNIETRARLLAATVGLKTSPNEGTRWEITFPV